MPAFSKPEILRGVSCGAYLSRYITFGIDLKMKLGLTIYGCCDSPRRPVSGEEPPTADSWRAEPWDI